MMKKNILPLFILLLCSHFVSAQKTDYNVVFDITSSDPANQKQVVREVSLIKAANPDAHLEVVVYGQGLDLLNKDKSTQTEEIKKLIMQKDVSFNACHVSMERNHVDKSQLIPGVGIVPDGIYEIISKQKQGWGYIKIAN